ncbi:MAG TPA: hypothetical protein VLB86_11025 [Gaiellaceae bacterium]|nr:hypothetical protein [Gaiellaceae bacterium]
MRFAAALLVVLLTLPPAAFASDRFVDPRGDAGDGPDITAVTLSHTDAVVRIAVEFASAPPLGFSEDEQSTDMLLVGIHTDEDDRLQDVEYATGVHGVDLTRGTVVQATGSSWRKVGDADATVEGATVTLEVARALLADPDVIAVTVAAGRESADESAGGGGDEAPASGPHRYVLADEGAPTWLAPLVVSGLAVLTLVALAVLTRRQRAWPRGLGPAH